MCLNVTLANFKLILPFSNVVCAHVQTTCHTCSAMKPTFLPNTIRPNPPLRKPSSHPVDPFPAVSPPGPVAMSGAKAAGPAFGQSPILSLFDKNKAAITGPTLSAVAMHLCSNCGHQGNFRCKRCKKTFYCSVACQTEDWKKHKDICKSIGSEPVIEKSKESSTFSNIVAPLKNAGISSSQRVYLKDLQVTEFVKEKDIQASVAEFYNPGRFFIYPQSSVLLDTLRSIGSELQKTYSRPTVVSYVPFAGEVCAAQYSCDMHWYRGLVQSLSTDHKMANILYIDFGNEEDVPVERIRPLASNFKQFCPCAIQCRIAGVEPVGDNWSDECCFAVRQMLAGKAISVRLVDILENLIHVVDVQLSVGKQLSTFLIEHSYAAEDTVSGSLTEQDIKDIESASWDNFKLQSSGTDDNSWAQPPEPLTQAVGDSFSVVVTHFQSPSEITVQKLDNARLIQELQLQLREHCNQVPSSQNFRPAPGTVCCAQFSEDKQWYRAKVLGYSSDKGVCVGYLDFGNCEEVGLERLQPISSSLLALPMQAMRCGLAGVQPICKTWSEECLLTLQRRVSNRILRIEIQAADEGKALVAMIDEASDPQANMAELLISAGFGAPAPVGTIADERVDQTTAAEPDVPTPTSEPLVWSCANLPCDGQTVALLTSLVENPGEFYCHIDSPADHQRLLELMTELKQHCEADATPFELKVGEPCCAMFPGHKEWYRAMVKGFCENLVSVSFVDFGYTMNVERSHLRVITPQLLTLPFQAIRCFLAGVEPLGSEWSSEAILWFQSLVDGVHLSARVLSFTTQGYGVKLESRGQNVAVALHLECLAKISGTMHETPVTTGSGPNCQENMKGNNYSQIHLQAFDHTGAASKEIPIERLGGTSSEVPSFPVDWKTEELPPNKTFQASFAAFTSPSLFYLFAFSQVDKQKLQEVMMEVAAYCTNNWSPLSLPLTKPAPGAACCAQFSADNNWYRAVVLETGESEIKVIYADYGNTANVPLSWILPIPAHLLQLPFQIVRCTLAGKEHFPATWSEEVLQMFRSFLLNGALATVRSFDGCANVLSLTLPTERGGGDLTAMILKELQVQGENSPYLTIPHMSGLTDSGTPVRSATTPPDSPEPRSKPETQKRPENTSVNRALTVTPQRTPQREQPNTISSAVSLSDPGTTRQTGPSSQNSNNPQTSSCCSCCQRRNSQMDHLVHLMQELINLHSSTS
ncbi:tudor domain-containing protein 1 [Betta splendens]|uniref:Tudor domain-containing protein 1 n=1 Tax=Betta splendens TaxID=158456 RepID=A0A6P7L636_BETSP|nr:tudor domain-containing protein 1 [Betta splendens]